MTWLLLLPFLLLLEGGDGDPPPDDDDDDDTPDDEDEDDELLDDDGKPIRNPKQMIASLKQANSRLSKKLRKRDDRIKELEAGSADGDELRTARLENAFLRAAIERDEAVEDLDTAWTLAESKGYFDSVKVGNDGAVDGMAKALDKLCDRYPYLVDVSDDDEPDRPRPSNTGRTPRPQRSSSQASSRSALGQRFPALRSRVRRGRA